MSKRATCSRCGSDMSKLSGLPACPRCGPSQRWGDRYDAPVEYAPGGTRRAPIAPSDGPEHWSVEGEDFFDSYDEDDPDFDEE